MTEQVKTVFPLYIYSRKIEDPRVVRTELSRKTVERYIPRTAEEYEKYACLWMDSPSYADTWNREARNAYINSRKDYEWGDFNACVNFLCKTTTDKFREIISVDKTARTVAYNDIEYIYYVTLKSIEELFQFADQYQLNLTRSGLTDER